MATQTTSETAIFERVVLSSVPAISRDAAQAILAWGFSPADLQRMQELADKARAGQLTPDEGQEVDNYERVGHYLSILQSKARQALQSTGRSNP